MASRAAPVYVADGVLPVVRAKKPFMFGVSGTVDGQPEATRGHKLEVTFPSGPRAVLPVKCKDNLKQKGAWIVEALLPADGEYAMSVKVDGKDIVGTPFTVKADSSLGSSNPPPASAPAPVLNSSAAFEPSSPSSPSGTLSLSNASAAAPITKDVDHQPLVQKPLNEEATSPRPTPASASAASVPVPTLRGGRGRQVTWSVVGLDEKLATRMEAGRPNRFQLHCRGMILILDRANHGADQNGIWAPSTSKIEPKFTGPRAIFPSLAAAHPGVWVIEWAATIAGDYTMMINVDGQPVAGPYTLPVQPPELTREQILEADNKRLAAPVAEPENPLRPKITDEMVNTTLDALKQAEETRRIWHMFGEGKKSATSGKTARIEMHAKDQYGTFVPLPTLHYLNVNFEGPAPIFPSRHEHASIRGIYIIEYKPVSAGTYTMHIKIDGEPIDGSPFQIAVAEGEKQAGIYYEATGPGVESATAGVAAKFQVQARDQDGLPAASAAVMRVKFEGPRPVFPHVQRKEDKKGFYMVEYCASKTGSYQMFVTVDDHPIDGSPFAVTVAPSGRAEVGTPGSSGSASSLATSDPQLGSEGGSPINSSAGGSKITVDRVRCEVSGMATESHVGRPLTFSVLAKSRHLEAVSGAKFDVSITEIKSSTPISFVTAETSAGTQVVNYTPSMPGAYRISVDFEGAPIPKSPFRVVIKDKPSALKSLLSRPSLFLQARTFGGEALADGGDDIFFNVDGPEPISTTVKDMSSGSYVLSYTQPTVPGFYTFTLKLNNEHVQNSPWTLALGTELSAAAMTDEEKQKAADEARKREEKRVAEEEARVKRDEDERLMREEVARQKALEEEERKKKETADAEARRKAILEAGESAAQSEVVQALRDELAAERKEKDNLLAKIAVLEKADEERRNKEEASKAAMAEAERKAREAAEKKAKEKADKKAQDEAERLEREAALAEKAKALQATAEVEANREVVKGDMSNTKTATFFKKEAQEAAAMLRARRQKELEDKQTEADAKAKKDAEAEEKAKLEAAKTPQAPAEPKQSIKDRGAALNLRVGALIPGSAPPPRKPDEEPTNLDASDALPAVPAAVEEKFATKSRPAATAARRPRTRNRKHAAPATKEEGDQHADDGADEGDDTTTDEKNDETPAAAGDDEPKPEESSKIEEKRELPAEITPLAAQLAECIAAQQVFDASEEQHKEVIGLYMGVEMTQPSIGSLIAAVKAKGLTLARLTDDELQTLPDSVNRPRGPADYFHLTQSDGKSFTLVTSAGKPYLAYYPREAKNKEEKNDAAAPKMEEKKDDGKEDKLEQKKDDVKEVKMEEAPAELAKPEDLNPEKKEETPAAAKTEENAKETISEKQEIPKAEEEKEETKTATEELKKEETPKKSLFAQFLA